ncbi:hypothetical protein A9G11_02375, partial [Gilliamella sp. wkB108]|uniref:hemagglutinin repeat-containing protein n=1 Tax=Gilliamella sp. wkB108 TaxID=3120256 RepID=UPI00080DDC6E
MNKHLYRVIFNKKRGIQMVVADIAKTPTGSEQTSTNGGQSHQKTILAKLKPISLFISISLSFVSIMMPAYGSDIVADNQANKRQQPQVITTANGVTQVNIQTPNSKGVSHNKYSQFDVSQQGAILNNSSKISQTQIGGYVQGNEFLNATGPAKIILNEVNSRNPSQLNGVVEVAGQKAQVIIANPSGITCNGCGFINASRSTLTTGKPVLENGELRGYVVENGNITVTGKGLDSSGQNYTDLIARTVSINSAVWANEVNVVTGRNQVSQDTQSITALDDNISTKPEVSIDVSQLGGMYAGKIRMVGTEKGVGVHNAGELGASAGNIVISADGKITNKGTMQARQDIALNSQQDINNSHQIYSKQNVELKSKKQIVNQGSLIAQNNINLEAKKINSTKDSMVAAGINEQGKLTNQGNIHGTAQDIAFNGKNSAGQDLILIAQEQLDLDNSRTIAKDLKLSSNTISLQSAQVQTEEQLNLNSTSINTSNAIIQSKNGINLTSNMLTNNHSQLLSEKAINLKAQQIVSKSSSISTNQSITIHADDVEMQEAKLSAKQDISLSGKAINADNLALITEQGLSIDANQLSTQGANVQAKNAVSIRADNYLADKLYLLTGQSLTLMANYIQLNQSKISALANIKVDAEQLVNQDAIWLTDKDINVKADKINNQSSQIKATGTVNYTFEQLNNDKATVIGKSLSFKGNTLYNQAAGLKADVGIIFDLNQFYNQQSRWQSGDNITVKATSLFDNKNSIIVSLGALSISTQTMTNDNSELVANKDLTIQTKQLSSDKAILQSGNKLQLSVDEQLDAKSAKLYSEGQIEVQSKALDLTKATITSKGDISLNGESQTLNQAQLLSGGKTNLDATNIEGDDVSLKSINDLIIKSLNSVSFKRGELITNQKLLLNTQNAQTANATLYAKGGIDINLKQLDNQNAVWFSDTAINLIAQQINNQKASIKAKQDVAIATEQFNNNEAVIVAEGGLVIDATDLDNTAAQIQTKDGIKIKVNNELKNGNSKLITEGQMQIDADDMTNANAHLYANDSISIHATNLNNDHSALFSGGVLNLISTTMNNQDSEIQAKQGIGVETQTLLSDRAKYVTEGGLDLKSQTASLNQAKLASRGDLNIDNTQALMMQKAELVAQKDIQIKADTINSTESLVNGLGYIDIVTNYLLNNKAQWLAKGYIRVNTENTDNNDSLLKSDSFISILANQRFNHEHGTLISGSNIDIHANEINNAYGQLGAEGHINVTGNALKNSHAIWVAKGDITIDGGDELENTSAQLASDQSLTIHAKQIANQKVVLSTKGNITVNTQQLDNTQAKLFSGQSIAIQSPNIINKEAVLKADEAITIDTQTLENSDAIVVAENLINIIADKISNHHATIQSKDQLAITTKQLDNQSAVLLSGTQGIKIDTQELNNQQAKLFTTGDLTINANNIANQEAKLIAEKTLKIKANQINNQKGELQAKGNVNIDAKELDNQQALIFSEKDIELNADNGINNHSSQLSANGLIKLTTLNDIDNTSAKLSANNGILLTAANLINQSAVLKTNGLISGKAKNIDNRYAQYVANNIMLESDYLNNQNAILTADSNLVINASDFDNSKAKLLANDIYLKTKSFHGDGTIKSKNNLSLELDESFINESEITVNGQLSIHTAQDIINKNKIAAGGQVILDSQQLINEQQAEISADNLSLTHKTLINYGLVDGKTAIIRADTLNNLSTGRIYADNLAIKAKTLNNRGLNGVAPVIAARSIFHLGVNILNNYTHAQLLSLGNFSIGGDLDKDYNVTGMAEVINNHSATIESQGNLWIATKALNNINDHIVTEMRKSDEAPEREIYFQTATGDGHAKYMPDEIRYRIKRKAVGNGAVGINCDKHKRCWYKWEDIPEGTRYTKSLQRMMIIKTGQTPGDSHQYDVIKQIYRTVILETDPGKIMASGNIVIQGEALNNQDSKIVAGKTVNINVDQFNNHSQEAISKYVYSGKVHHHTRQRKGKYDYDSSDYHKADEVFIDDALNHNILDHQIFTGTQLKEEPRQKVAVENSNHNINIANQVQSNTLTESKTVTKPKVGLNQNEHPAIGQTAIAVDNKNKNGITQVTPKPTDNIKESLTNNKVIDATQTTVVNDSNLSASEQQTKPSKTISVFEPNLTLPDNSLWIVNKDCDKNYVVETDPRFTQRKKWLSSDYMLNRLRVNQDSVLKRLGDGYYEQQLIREQIVGLTGNRYLGNYQSDIEQYQALMDAGVNFAQAYGIVPGVELSPEQMQALTTDMVWLVKKTVTVNGQAVDVLVPQVYIVNRTKLGTDGALISGENVFVKGQELNTNGLITAKQDVLLKGHNVTNKGTIVGERVAINAENDITNYGKLLGDKLVYLSADNDINLLSSTRTQTRDRNITTNIDQGSTVQVNNGNILIDAKHDINAKAGWIINSGEKGETWLQAGHDIQFTAADIEEKLDFRFGKKDYRITDEKSAVGTEISAANDIKLLAGNDINAKTVDIFAGNQLALQAGNDINIGASTEEFHLDEFHKSKSKGFLSKSTSTSRVVEDDVTQKGSILSGDKVTINAGNNLNVTGSQVVGSDDVVLKAGKNITIDAAEESYYRFEQTKTKKSGFSASKQGVSYGSQSSKLTSTQNETNNSATTSLIGTSNGNVIIDAGKQVTINSSDIVAGRAKDDTTRAKGHIDISGEDIVIIPGQDTVDRHTTYKSKSTSIGVSFSNPIIDSARNIRDIFKSPGGTTDKVKQLSNEFAAVGMDMGLPTQLPITYSHSSSKSESTLHGEYQHGSSLTAAGNIQLHATKGQERDEKGQLTHGDVHISGSQLSAGEAIIIDANRDVNIVTSTDKQNEENKSKDKQWNVTSGAPTAGSSARFVGGSPNNGTGLLPYGYQSSSVNGKNNVISQTASELTANEIYINSREGNVNVSGSLITAVNDLIVKAKQGDINVTPGTNQAHSEEKGRSKFFGELNSDGYSGTVGFQDSRYKNLDDSTSQSDIRSELNSIKGNVSLTSGGDIHLVGTDITAGKSVDLTGKNVLMDVGEDSKYQKYISKNKQYGVTVSTSGYAVTAAQSLEKAARAIENHEDKRLSAIYAAQAALNLYSQSRQLANSSSQASQNVTQTADTNLQKTPVWKEKASSLVKGKVSLTADSSKQTHEYEQRLQSGTVIHAGENVNINAKENIEGKGVDIQGKNINLNAGQDIKFSAAQDMERVKNTDSGSHYGVGVGVNFGGSQNGFSLELSGSQSKGKENGNSENNTNSIIHARDKLNIHSGRDVILTGAELQGNRVVADIGRDLLISSLQDKEDYNSKHTSAGLNASICVPPFCAGSSQVSGSFSQDKMKSDYASVNEQSGIFAGEGGYDITVGNHTELTGAVIASEAEDKTRNRLETGTIGFSDIKNKAEYNVSSISVSGGA